MRVRLGLVPLLLLAVPLADCARRGRPAGRSEAGNVLFVTIDTLRADHVGCYGHAGAATPTLDGLAARGVRWLAAPASARPFFLWVHYYDPHAPYEPPGDLALRFRSSPYDGEIAFVDLQLARLLRALDERGALAHTLVLVTADHGEGLGEHGEGTHGLFVYDATLRVPWIMAGAGVPAGRVSATVARGIDVLPTLLDYAGLALPAAMEGRSLRPAAEGGEMGDAPAYAE